MNAGSWVNHKARELGSSSVYCDQSINAFDTQSSIGETFCTPSKKAKRKEGELDQTSGYDSILSTEDLQSFEISRYLNTSADESNGNEEDANEAEISQLQELMKTPDMKTADQFLTTLAEFSPSNRCRSPLANIASPRFDLFHNSFSSTTDSSSCSSMISSKISTSGNHKTSTPFSFKRHFGQEGTLKPTERETSCCCHNEDTVLFTPTTADDVRKRCHISTLERGAATPKRKSEKSRKLHFHKHLVSKNNTQQFNEKYVIPTTIDEAAAKNDRDKPVTMSQILKKTIGKVKIKEHSPNSNLQNRKRTAASLTVRPFQKGFKQDVSVATPSQQVKEKTATVKKKRRKRLSPIRLPDTVFPDDTDKFMTGKWRLSFMSPFHQNHIEQSRSHFDSALQRAVGTAQEKIRLPRSVCNTFLNNRRSRTAIFSVKAAQK